MEDVATDVSVIYIFALISILLVFRHFFNQTEFETDTLQENCIIHRTTNCHQHHDVRNKCLYRCTGANHRLLGIRSI